MKLKKFPTKAQFIAYWDNKRDVFVKGQRNRTCPIARCLKAGGFKDVDVGYYFFHTNTLNGRIPKWSVALINSADTQLIKTGPYRGLPKGFK